MDELKELQASPRTFSREKDHDMETAQFKPIWMQELMEKEKSTGPMTERIKSETMELESQLKDRESSDPITVQEIRAYFQLNGVERFSEIDMREKVTWTETFLIAYVPSGRQLKSLSESLLYQVK